MAVNGKQPHIIAINHSPDVLGLLADLLSEEGYRVTTRSHLDHGLGEFRDLAPDLFIVDYMWPTDDDNWSLLQLIRLDPVLKNVPIVLCTGAVAETRGLAEHLVEMQIHVVWKPFELEQLLTAIAAALHHDSALRIDPLI